MRNSIEAGMRTCGARRASCLAARDFFVAVAMADRLSALLTENVARKARRARSSLSAPTSLPYSDLCTRNCRRFDARRSRPGCPWPDPPTGGGADRGCIVTAEVMPWLADTDVGAAHGFARRLLGARTVSELRRRALSGLAELVPADVLMWDRVELATGVVRHEAIPAEAEPPGAFAAIVGDVAGHPLLSAHAAGRRPALRLSEAVEPRRLSHGELYGDLLHPSGVEYAIT